MSTDEENLRTELLEILRSTAGLEHIQVVTHEELRKDFGKFIQVVHPRDIASHIALVDHTMMRDHFPVRDHLPPMILIRISDRDEPLQELNHLDLPPLIDIKETTLRRMLILSAGMAFAASSLRDFLRDFSVHAVVPLKLDFPKEPSQRYPYYTPKVFRSKQTVNSPQMFRGRNRAPRGQLAIRRNEARLNLSRKRGRNRLGSR